MLAQLSLCYEGESGCPVADLKLLGAVEMGAMVNVDNLNNARGGDSLFIPLSAVVFMSTPHFGTSSSGLVRPCGDQHLSIGESPRTKGAECGTPGRGV